MKHLDLFSGIGGFALAAQTVWGAEYECVGFCDNNYFCQQVLSKNFPGVPIYDDIRTLTNTASGRERSSKSERNTGGQSQTKIRNINRDVDLLTGGFPCQPFSAAGKRKGTADDRYLWPEMFRVISEFKPTWVIAENVKGLITWSEGMVLEQVCTDLESQGYEVQPFIIPACGVNAPHRRERVWIVAHAIDDRSRGTQSTGPGPADRIPQEYRQEDSTPREFERTNSNREADRLIAYPKNKRPVTQVGLERIENKEATKYGDENYQDWSRDWQEVAFATCNDRVDDGLSKRLVRLPDGNTISYAKWRQEALKAYGNAIVPQVAMEIMKGIKLGQ